MAKISPLKMFHVTEVFRIFLEEVEAHFAFFAGRTKQIEKQNESREVRDLNILQI